MGRVALAFCLKGVYDRIRFISFFVFCWRRLAVKKLLLIVNPRAGKSKSLAPLYEAIARLSAGGYLVHVRETAAPGDATRFARDIGPLFDTVACYGGDGTLNETISGLMQLAHKPLLGYLPAGSTNDFAATLHIPAVPYMAAEIITQGTPMALDVGRHNNRYFSYVASFGAFTKASYSAPQEVKNALGHFAYILEGIKSLDSLRPYHCRITADEETIEGDFIFGSVCNSTSLAGLVKLDPNRVRMDDGVFELVLLRMPRTLLDLTNLLVALNQMQYDDPGIFFRHASRVTVETADDIPWSLDGEYAPSSPVVNIENCHGAVRLLVKKTEGNE